MKEHMLPFLGEYLDWCLLGRPDYSLYASRSEIGSNETLVWEWSYHPTNEPSTAYVKLLDLLDERLTRLRNQAVRKSDEKGENHYGSTIYWLIGFADILSRQGIYMAKQRHLYPHERQDLLADIYGLICQFYKYTEQQFDERSFDAQLKREWIWAMNAEVFNRYYWYDEECTHFGGDAVGWCTEEGRL